jgi:hypothetical protein
MKQMNSFMRAYNAILAEKARQIKYMEKTYIHNKLKRIDKGLNNQIKIEIELNKKQSK